MMTARNFGLAPHHRCSPSFPASRDNTVCTLLERGRLAQAVLDILAVIAAALLVVATGLGTTAAIVILLFVRL